MPFDDGLEVTKTIPIVDISDEGATFELGGKTYTLRKLRLGDYAACQSYIRSRKLEAVIKATELCSEETRSMTLAAVMNKPMAVLDIWNELEGETLMLQRGMTIDGKAVTIEHVMNMEPCSRKHIVKVLMYLMDLAPDPTQVESDDADPTTTDQKTGTTTSPNSVDTTSGVRLASS